MKYIIVDDNTSPTNHKDTLKRGMSIAGFISPSLRKRELNKNKDSHKNINPINLVNLGHNIQTSGSGELKRNSVKTESFNNRSPINLKSTVTVFNDLKEESEKSLDNNLNFDD